MSICFAQTIINLFWHTIVLQLAKHNYTIKNKNKFAEILKNDNIFKILRKIAIDLFENSAEIFSFLNFNEKLNCSKTFLKNIKIIYSI